MGFSQPVSVATLSDGTMYVANRGGEQNPSARITKCTIGNTDGKGGEEFLGEFGREGIAYQASSRGLFEWITGIALDAAGNVYASDEWKDMVAVFDADGNLVSTGARAGTAKVSSAAPPGWCSTPMTTSGWFRPRAAASRSSARTASTWEASAPRATAPRTWRCPPASPSTTPATFTSLTGATTGCRSTPAGGTHLRTFGSQGTRSGELNHPLDVTIDNDGDVYVADWMNERVVIYDADARPLAYLEGDATEVSEWGDLSLNANPDMVKARRRVPDLEAAAAHLPDAHGRRLRPGEQPVAGVRYPAIAPSGLRKGRLLPGPAVQPVTMRSIR